MLGRPEQGNISLWAIILAHAPVEHKATKIGDAITAVADSTTTVTFGGSEENDAADRVVLFIAELPPQGPLDLDRCIRRPESHSSSGCSTTENARLVALDQQRVRVHLTWIFIVGELQIRYAIAEADFELVELVVPCT